MIAVRKAEERGLTKTAWLDSRHSFSFGHYYDPAQTGFGPLRVINDDRIAPGKGFARHAHDNMEIVTYVIEGALEHKDSLGNGSAIGAGELQRMSAGRGIEHSEFNRSGTEPVHLLQIWILPEAQGLDPSYEQKSFASGVRPGELRLAGSRDGRDGSITIHQDVDLYLAHFRPMDRVSFEVREGRRAWLQVMRGRLSVGAHTLEEGDGAAFSGECKIEIGALDQANFLLFDLR